MPTRARTVLETEEANRFFEAALLFDSDDNDSSDDEFVDLLLFAGMEPQLKRRRQVIGKERLSIARLRHEAQETRNGVAIDGDDEPSSVYTKFRFRLNDLARVVAALEVPHEFSTAGNHHFTGEEAVLLLLWRFRSSDGANSFTLETGRSEAAISECVQYMVEHIHARFPHLIDERSFTAWSSKFAEFAAAFRRWGVPVPNLIAFLDGKLWPVCRPGRWQRVLFSGHKRIHGLKTQGAVFPNGIQPYPYGAVDGSRHDSFVLRMSGIVDVLRAVCAALGVNYVMFGDSAYPISRWLWAMYKGVMTPAQQMFNSDMSPARVTVEWGFGKIAALWPFLDYRKNQQVLLRPVGMYLNVGNVLTNMHTCLYGSIVGKEFGMVPPTLELYMQGGPF